MVFRTAGALATLLIGLAGPGGQALAQYYPAPPAYPPAEVYQPPRAYPTPRAYPPLPSVDADEEGAYDQPMVARPLPPAPIGAPVPEPLPPSAAGATPGHSAIEEAELPPLAPGAIPREPAPGYREPPPSYPVPPPAVGYRDAPPPYPAPPSVGYRDVPPSPEGQVYGPAGYPGRPYYGQPNYGQPGGPYSAPVPPPAPEQDAMRPPLPIGPGQADPGVTGIFRADPRHQMAALPPEVRPETGPVKQLPAQFRRTLVEYHTKEPAGTIVIDTQNTYLYLVLGNGKALRYGVGVGREGFTWSGAEKVSKMAEWPDWNPPPEMIERQPYLPRFMAGGDGNPLGARALYLGKTIYRIHGTNQPSTIGTFVSSGCIRLTNEDVMDLYNRVKVGTRVVVLPGHPPATTAAAAAPVGQPPSAAARMPPGGVPLGPPPTALAR